MKNKIKTSTLVEIERQIDGLKSTGLLSYTTLSKLMHNESVSCDVLAKAIDLAFVMPKKEIEKMLLAYDQSSPKMDELLFVRELQNRYKVNRNDVILRIQYVRQMKSNT